MGKLGIDIHGVIDKRPVIFSKLSHEIRKQGHEVHILTGSIITVELVNELKKYNIEYDKLFSIIDYHKRNNNIDIWQDSKDNWWLNDDIWNKTKGIYCKMNNIDLHIDDTMLYSEYFETPFSLFKHKENEIHYNYNDMNNEFVKYILDIISDKHNITMITSKDKTKVL